ncbi:MAG TPA: hypothetical protein VM680_20220 [Verrucomicrobiae bacterium]|nr:hypothetical protein [Verrucomicrobiae bacterium]
MLSSLFSITPRIRGDSGGITATTGWMAELLMLGAAFRRVRVDPVNESVTIRDRTWWFRRRERVILFGEVAGVGYGYEEWSWGFWARNPIDCFVVSLKLKWGEEARLFNFVGDGTFTNDGPLPDWMYWKEYAFDMTGTQEQESRMFAKVLGKVLQAPLGPSSLTRE